MEAREDPKIGDLQGLKEEQESRQQRRYSQDKENRIWNKQEVYLVAAFLYHNHQKFSSESTKKKWKVFKFMSLFVSTRNINQCRTYFRKLLKTFKTVPSINLSFKSSLSGYDSAVQQLKERSDRLYRQFTYSEDGDTDKLSQSIQKQGEFEQELSVSIAKKQQESSISDFVFSLYRQKEGENKTQECFYTQRLMWSHVLFQEWMASLQKLYTLYWLS